MFEIDQYFDTSEKIIESSGNEKKNIPAHSAKLEGKVLGMFLNATNYLNQKNNAILLDALLFLCRYAAFFFARSNSSSSVEYHFY